MTITEVNTTYGMQRREALERLLQQVYAAANGRYGAPRIAAEIQAKHHYVSVNTVSKYMKRMGLRSKLSRRYRNVNYPEYTLRTCSNYLDRHFTVDAPCRVWVSDITYIHTTHGFRYLISVIDLYDRKGNRLVDEQYINRSRDLCQGLENGCSKSQTATWHDISFGSGSAVYLRRVA